MEWILTIIGAALAAYGSYRAADAVNRRRWTEMDGVIKNFRDDHIKHFEAESKIDTSLARAEQRISSHEAQCIESRERIEAMFKEIREYMRGR